MSDYSLNLIRKGLEMREIAQKIQKEIERECIALSVVVKNRTADDLGSVTFYKGLPATKEEFAKFRLKFTSSWKVIPLKRNQKLPIGKTKFLSDILKNIIENVLNSTEWYIFKIMEYSNNQTDDTFTWKTFPDFFTEEKCHEYIEKHNIYCQIWVYNRADWKAYMAGEIDDIEPIEIYDSEMIGGVRWL